MQQMAKKGFVVAKKTSNKRLLCGITIYLNSVVVDLKGSELKAFFA